ncbi:MAG: Rab family GTPase [Promethearchaeota archaeon]
MSERVAAFKLCIFGDGGVGKTTLAHRFMYKVFEEDLKMTIGADFSVKELEIDGKLIALRIWDFGGERRYQVLFPGFVQGAQGGIFMYDTTRYATLNRMENWLSFFKDPKDKKINIPIIMVGSKIDLIEKRSVPKEDAEFLMEKYNLNGYIECSSKTGENVELVFETIAKLMMQKAGLL